MNSKRTVLTTLVTAFFLFGGTSVLSHYSAPVEAATKPHWFMSSWDKVGDDPNRIRAIATYADGKGNMIVCNEVGESYSNPNTSCVEIHP